MSHKILRPGFKSIHGIVVSDEQFYWKSGKIETIGPKFRFDDDLWQVCQCECGKVFVADATKIRQSYRPTTSCGCSRHKHNMRDSRMYKEWRRVWFAHECQESWKEFKSFYSEITKEIGEPPCDDSRITKIDKKDIFRIGNIQWLTRKSGNTRKTTKKSLSQPPKMAAKTLCLF